MSIPTGLLTATRRLAERSLPDECTVISVTRTPNDSGGWTPVEGTPVEVACRLGPVSGRERIFGGQVVAESDAVITLPADTTIAETSRITHDGDTYEVTDIQERSEAIVMRVLVRKS